MDRSRLAAAKSSLIDALLLACSHSGLRDIVGTDALRGVLEMEYREIIAEGSFDLESVWQLLKDQPGVEPDVAAAPLCRFKSWERQLGISIVLPAELRHLGVAEMSARAAECKVPVAELQTVVRSIRIESGPHPIPGSGQASEPHRKPHTTGEVERRARITGSGPISQVSGRADSQSDAHRRPRVTQPQPGSEPLAASSSRRNVIQLGAALVALVGFGIAGVSLYRGCRTQASWDAIPADFAGTLPITRPARIGDQVRAELTDDSWLERPASERRAALGEALRNLENKGITVLFLVDKAGRVRATVQSYANQSKTRFIFQ